ncbi:uncharacterized protein LOC133893542 [Phragmites australis]|uniref:uncharacterized protein LOC133893542 n=1 Tax=Phragmites australis TaxID=29695 RepID=UPI002D76C95E|nr:uncharacterized protein LOC133893542 [Phragmites australis]
MATKSLLPVPVTLCFLLVLAAQGTEAVSVLAVVSGKAQCRNNPSRVISDASLHVVINGTTVIGNGKTSSTGQFLVMMDVTSKDQLNSLASSGKAVITVAPGVCGTGAPSDAAVVTTLVAPVRPRCGYLMLKTNLGILLSLLDGIVDDLDASSSDVRVDVCAGGGLPTHQTPMEHEEASGIIWNLLSAMKNGDGKMGVVFLESGQFANELITES